MITIDLTGKTHTSEGSEQRPQDQRITLSKVERATLRALERRDAQTHSRARQAVLEDSYQRFHAQHNLMIDSIAFQHRLLQESSTFITTRASQVYDPLEQARQQYLQSILQPAMYSPSFWFDRYTLPDYAAVDRDLCAKALEAVTHGESDEFNHFVVQTLGLPITHATAVWMVLREGRWVQARKPLHYIWKAAKCQFAREERHRADAQSARQNGDHLVRPILTDGPTRKVIGRIIDDREPSDPLSELSTIQCLDAACRILNLSDDARIMAQATLLYELPRRQLQRHLRWSVQQTERAWKEFSRRREQLILVLKKIS